MAETKIYEDNDIIIWENVVGQPGDPNYAVDRRTENKPGSAAANRLAILDAARNAMATNRTFVALAAPTNAQAVAQTKALSRQMNGVIRVLLDAYDATD